MYLIFKLDESKGFDEAVATLDVLRSEMAEWAATNEVEYEAKVLRYIWYVEFTNESSYALFEKTWQGLSNWEIIS